MSRPPRRYYGWTLVVALGVITIVVYGTVQYFFGVLVVPVGRELGWSRTELALGFSIALVVAGVLGYPVGRWVDRHGARAAIALGTLIGGASLLLLSFVTELWQWELLWGGGLGVAGALTLYPVTFTVVANWFHRRRGAAMALLTVIGGLASPIFIPLAGWLIAHAGWRETLVIFGCLQLGVALPVALVFVRRHPEDVGLFPDGAASHDGGTGSPLSGTAARHAIRTAPFWTLTVSQFVGLMGSNALFAHQIAYMIGRGQGSESAATLAGAVGLASLPGRYVFNVLSDRFRSQWLLGICQAVMAIGVAILALAGSTTLFVVYVVVYGAAFGAASPLTASVRAEHFGRRAFGSITAIQGIPALAGAAAGPLAAGWGYDRSGSYDQALAGVALLYVASAVAMFLTPKPPPGAAVDAADPADVASDLVR